MATSPSPRQGRPRSGGDRGASRDPDANRVRELAAPLARIMRRLPEIERRVLQLRMGLLDGYTHNLAETARELNLTMQEAREIEQRAFERIRQVVPLEQLHKYLEG